MSPYQILSWLILKKHEDRKFIIPPDEIKITIDCETKFDNDRKLLLSLRSLSNFKVTLINPDKLFYKNLKCISVIDNILFIDGKKSA